MTITFRGWLLLLPFLIALSQVAEPFRPTLAALGLAALALALRQRWIRFGRRRRRRLFSQKPSRPSRRLIPAKTRHYVLARDGHACIYCGRRRGPAVALQLDHLYPYSLGGTDDPENLVAACGPCNLAKGVTVFRSDRDLAAFARRRQTWATDLRRQRRPRFPPWPLIAVVALLLAACLLNLLG